MTTEIKKPFDKGYISSFSKEMGEPTWLTDLRVLALEQAENLPLPKADKTRIEKWNFSQFEKHIVKSEDFTSFDHLPDKVKMLIDVNKSNQSLYIQRNNRPTLLSLSTELKENGVIFT